MKPKSGRLKNFCEICRRKFRDQNGFHCHLNSITHQNKKREFQEDPTQHIEKHSRQLQWKFVMMLKLKYPGEPKNINDLYEQYKQQKYHIDFNVTEWKNLAEFCEYLKGVRNISVVGEFPNCKVTYLVSKSIDFINENKKKQIAAMRQKQKEQVQLSLKSKIEKSKQLQKINFQRLRDQAKRRQEEFEQYNPDKRLEIIIEGLNQSHKRNPIFNIEELQEQFQHQQVTNVKKIKNADLLLQRINKTSNSLQIKQQKQSEQVEWIIEEIFVKILPHQISEVFHGKKCKINKIVEPYVAEVEVGNAKLQIDQSHLETVIPKCGNKVKLLLGDKKGQIGILEKVYIQQGFGVINIQQKVYQVPFNGFSKTE